TQRHKGTETQRKPASMTFICRLSLCLCAFVSLCFLFTSCKVGPTYKTPPAPVPANFKEPPPANWKEAQPQDTELRGNWWEMFGDPHLNALEEQVNPSNQSIALAEAQFRSAPAAMRLAGAALYPPVTAGAPPTAIRSPTTRFSPQTGFNVGTGTLYQLPIDVSSEGDLWGRFRRNTESNL